MKSFKFNQNDIYSNLVTLNIHVIYDNEHFMHDDIFYINDKDWQNNYLIKNNDGHNEVDYIKLKNDLLEIFVNSMSQPYDTDTLYKYSSIKIYSLLSIKKLCYE